jgi:hypothetical protein
MVEWNWLRLSGGLFVCGRNEELGGILYMSKVTKKVERGG